MEMQNKTYEGIIDMFIDNWDLDKTESRKMIINRTRDDPRKEWNPARESYTLNDLDLPRRMLLGCVFDPRHFEKEDITDIRVHMDPLVELCLMCARAEFMAQVRVYWRNLRDTDDDSL